MSGVVDAAVVADEPTVALYGIRHHGPGSARALLRVLRADPPDIVLIEGPPEADAIVALAADAAMEPPVTLLGYVVDHPERAVFSPFASFSPEWVALRWAADAEVPVRFIDLPLANALAAGDDDHQGVLTGSERPADPLADLARVAGYDDPERWWEDVVEHRDGASTFAAIADAMAVLREAYDPDLVAAGLTERRREARMRSGIRSAIADGHRRIAVVCGAWHVPALNLARRPGQAKLDAATLRGAAKVRTAVTWVPWTHRRLASSSGYRAGVASPGWYHHLFSHPGDDTVARWFTEAARVLRRHDHRASAADVVEATRLATMLAALRNRPLAGLEEIVDSSAAVFGDGSDVPLRLIRDELIIGASIGRVPDDTPMAPVARDLAREQRRCRLKPSAALSTVELDLRRPLDRSRSQLLHRLNALSVPWGALVDGRRSAGTFRETWSLEWEPELEVGLIEASALGGTVVAAARAAIQQRAGRASSLAELTELIEVCLLADVVEPLGEIVEMVAARAAVDVDVVHLMDATPALVRTVRYGDVRSTDATMLTTVLRGIVTRLAAGLSGAASGLDADAAEAMARSINDTRAALTLLGEQPLIDAFNAALGEIHEREQVHAVLQGRATRLLADGAVMSTDDVERRVGRALSPASAPGDAAAFIEGFLGESGAVIVHDVDLLGVIDRWLSTLDAEAFITALPLLRRTFGTFQAAERRQIGEWVRHGGTAPADQPGSLDPQRVAAALETIAQLLGAPR